MLRLGRRKRVVVGPSVRPVVVEGRSREDAERIGWSVRHLPGGKWQATRRRWVFCGEAVYEWDERKLLNAVFDLEEKWLAEGLAPDGLPLKRFFS